MPLSLANFRLISPRRRRGYIYNSSSSPSPLTTYFSIFLRNKEVTPGASFAQKYSVQRIGALKVR